MPFAYRIPFLIPNGSSGPPPPPTVLPVALVSRGTLSQGLPHRPVPIGTSANPNPYGVDISNADDIDPYFSLTGGIQVLAQDQYHAITSRPGSVPGRANTVDVRAMLSQSVTTADLQTIQASLSSVLEDDERIQQAQVTLSFQQETQYLTVAAVNLPLNPQGGSAQPFRFVAGISTAGSSLLSVSTIGG